MRTRTIRRLILLGLLSLVGIIVVQIFWTNRAEHVLKETRVVQEREFREEQKRFNDRVIIALTNVAEKILSLNNDNSEAYNVVKQLRSNYFVVQINDTLHPYLLESLLKREFNRRNIKEDFEYGIYDCFTDSVVYGNYITFEKKEISEDSLHASKAPQVKFENDGHYFSVYFPAIAAFNETSKEENSLYGWIFASLVILLVLGFFVYSVFVVLQQKRLAEIKNDFINNMTHELKTPISTIALSGEVLLKPDIKNDPDRITQYARIIKQENIRLENLVERVLQLASLEKEKIQLKKSPINVHSIIQECFMNFSPTVEASSGKIHINLHAEKFEIEADKVHITNMIFNLVDNARKYSGQNPEITISTHSNSKGIYIEVRDNGIGIAKENQQHIFDKFYRVSTGNVHNVKGFGLGLYYVRYMARQHGGNVSVASQPGKGSTFTIFLPFKN
jgi:two-component system phosphate regulon sensor histidine kinase PhoR